MDTYDQDPTEYLDGARYCLDKNDVRYLSYAALELRRFVEARQYEYLIAQKKYRKSLPKTHEIAKQFHALQKIYSGEKVQILHQIFEDGFEFEFRFAPVGEYLRRSAEKMSEWLHAPKAAVTERAIDEFRNLAEEAYAEAREVNAGNLLCPALLMNKSTIGELTSKLSNEDAKDLSARLFEGAKVIVNVRYE